MANVLDDQTYLQRYDKNGMLGVISTFPESCQEAIDATEKVSLKGLMGFQNVVVAGMGGSAIGGILLRDWLQFTSPYPIIVSRQYRLPAFVGKNTLLIAVSYSGGTEETLSSLEDGMKRNAKIVTCTSGGRMLELATEKKLPCLKLPTGFQPRAAIPHQFFALAVAARKLNFADESWGEVDEALGVLRGLRDESKPSVPLESNLCKKLAYELKGYIPFVYGAGIHEGVSYRWSTQINENSKSPAGSNFLPEAFHNATMVGESRKELLKKVCAVIIHDPEESQEIVAKTNRFRNILARNFGKILDVKAYGKSRLARMLSALYIGDYTSAYLALLYKKDPTAVDSIAVLKRG